MGSITKTPPSADAAILVPEILMHFPCPSLPHVCGAGFLLVGQVETDKKSIPCSAATFLVPDSLVMM